MSLTNSGDTRVRRVRGPIDPRKRIDDAARLSALDDAPAETLLSPRDVHAVFGPAPVTLRLWARQGRGPRVVRVEGRPRYRLGDLRAWLQQPAA
jgi:hypothetical protein